MKIQVFNFLCAYVEPTEILITTASIVIHDEILKEAADDLIRIKMVDWKYCNNENPKCQ
ncbi:hypothetical protein [uncultured Methanobrevibacter sp.]|jgi:hypothetical protein|uniref:hypothetical protein n=1 Tax=uncultured Methanobrevibacter sp. TaxID=253161 RepID=UPI0025E9D3BE|nr:hypothetical protein [uncultured Methanobrevibacter sp.]